jgi:hypothetical protein
MLQWVVVHMYTWRYYLLALLQVLQGDIDRLCVWKETPAVSVPKLDWLLVSKFEAVELAQKGNAGRDEAFIRLEVVIKAAVEEV